MNASQMGFESELSRPGGVKLQESFTDPWLQIDSDGSHVAHELGGRFLESEKKALFATPACGISKMRGDTGLPAAGHSGNEHRAAPEVSLAFQHRIETGDPGRNTLRGGFMGEAERTEGKDRYAFLLNQERILVRAVGGSPVFYDPQAPGGKLVRDAMIQNDHTIGDVLFQSVASQPAVTPLGGDDGCKVLVLEPTKQAAKFCPE